MSNDITNWESQKVQNKCPGHANEVATYAARLRPGSWCFSVSRTRKRPGHSLNNDHLTHLQTVNGANLFSGWLREKCLLTQKNLTWLLVLLWSCNDEGPSHPFADGELGKLALKMTSELLSSKHLVLK